MTLTTIQEGNEGSQIPKEEEEGNEGSQIPKEEEEEDDQQRLAKQKKLENEQEQELERIIRNLLRNRSLIHSGQRVSQVISINHKDGRKFGDVVVKILIQMVKDNKANPDIIVNALNRIMKDINFKIYTVGESAAVIQKFFTEFHNVEYVIKKFIEKQYGNQYLPSYRSKTEKQKNMENKVVSLNLGGKKMRKTRNKKRRSQRRKKNNTQKNSKSKKQRRRTSKK